MSAGLRAFAEGLRGLSGAGKQFVSEMDTVAKAQDRQARLAYLDQVGKLEAQRVKFAEAGTPLDEVMKTNPLAARMILQSAGVDPEAANGYEGWLARSKAKLPDMNDPMAPVTQEQEDQAPIAGELAGKILGSTTTAPTGGPSIPDVDTGSPWGNSLRDYAKGMTMKPDVAERASAASAAARAEAAAGMGMADQSELALKLYNVRASQAAQKGAENAAVAGKKEAFVTGQYGQDIKKQEGETEQQYKERLAKMNNDAEMARQRSKNKNDIDVANIQAGAKKEGEARKKREWTVEEARNNAKALQEQKAKALSNARGAYENWKAAKGNPKLQKYALEAAGVPATSIESFMSKDKWEPNFEQFQDAVIAPLDKEIEYYNMVARSYSEGPMPGYKDSESSPKPKSARNAALFQMK